MTCRKLGKKSKRYQLKPAIWRTAFELGKKKERIAALENEVKEQGFWQDVQRAGEVNKEISDLKGEIALSDDLLSEVQDLQQLAELAETDEKLQLELEPKIRNLENRIKQEEFRVFLSGKYDSKDAILSIYAGAGGQDSQDWATMLLRMYQRYAERKGFKSALLHQSFGEGGGPEGRIGNATTLSLRTSR